jgi:hypothetical protein
MTADELQTLLSQGEGQRLEFKEDAVKPSDLAQTFVAMANAQGGTVLIGVNDAGQPVGVRSYQQTYDLVMTAASHELCDPPIAVADVQAVALPDAGQILAVTIPRSPLLHAAHGRFLVRRGSQNVSMTTTEVAARAHHLDTGGLTALPIAGGLQALYEVQRFASTLDLVDASGETAILSRDQTIRFLQDGVLGLYDQVWGEGDLFADYQVEPGVVADHFQLGSRYIALISLRQIKNRGDVLRLRVRREIRQGWTQPEEWLETVVSHRTRLLLVSVVFPAQRPPTRAVMVEVSTGASQELGGRSWRETGEGRQTLVWQKRSPRLGETYLLRWWW